MERGEATRPFSNLIGGTMVDIIIKKPGNFGRTRSEQEQNLRKEWGSTVTDEQLDKIKHLEKKAEQKFGSKPNFISPIDADKVK